jgi:hypothetical protein
MAVRVIGRMVQVLLGCGLIVTAVVLVRMHRVPGMKTRPNVIERAAGRTYKQRINATETLLKFNTLELSSK